MIFWRNLKSFSGWRPWGLPVKWGLTEFKAVVGVYGTEQADMADDGDNFSTRFFVAAARCLDDVVTVVAVSRGRSLVLDELLDFAFGREHAEEGLMLRVCSLNSFCGVCFTIGNVGAVGAVRPKHLKALVILMRGHCKSAVAPSKPMPSLSLLAFASARAWLVADPVMMMVGMEADPGLLDVPWIAAVGADSACTCVGVHVVI